MDKPTEEELKFGVAIQISSERLFSEVREAVVAGVYSEDEGSRMIMGAATFLIMLGDALAEEGHKIKNPLLELN